MKNYFSFRPKLIDSLKDYSAQTFVADLTAGLTVGVVALPLALALAIASGLKPEVGIFTAIIGGFWFHCSVVRACRSAARRARSCRCSRRSW